jgi:hypothetical protein
MRKPIEVGQLATSSSAKWQTGQVIKSRNVVQTHVPIRPTRDNDVSVGSWCEGAVETPGGYYEKCPIHLKAGKCRTTFRTEAFLVPVPGTRNLLILPLPDRHSMLAVDENRLLACADPVSF